VPGVLRGFVLWRACSGGDFMAEGTNPTSSGSCLDGVAIHTLASVWARIEITVSGFLPD